LVFFRAVSSSSSRLRKPVIQHKLAHDKSTSYDKIVNTTIRPTDGQSVELRSSLRGLALFFASSSLSLFFSATATSRTCLSSCSRSVIRRSFSVAFFSRSTRLFARSAKFCHGTTSSLAALR
jgi:hypothetical protein